MKAIVFDFGNVIGFFDHRRAAARLAQHSDSRAEDIQAALSGSDWEDQYESGRIASSAFIQYLQERFGLRCSEEETASAYADIFWPNPEVCALLPRLKPRFRLLLGSNTTELHARQFKRQFSETLSHFESLVLSYEIGVRKPRAAFFENCRRLAACDPGECLFIDDLPANVAGARACGWHGIVYRGTEELLRELAALGIDQQ